MEDDVDPASRLAGFGERVFPRQDHRPAINGLADGRVPLVDHVRPMIFARYLETPGIDKDRRYPVEGIDVQAQHQQAGERGNGHLHLVGDVKSATTLPAFLGDEDAQVIAQLGLLCLAEAGIMSHILAEIGEPFRRKRLRQDLPSPVVFEPGEDHKGLS